MCVVRAHRTTRAQADTDAPTTPSELTSIMPQLAGQGHAEFHCSDGAGAVMVLQPTSAHGAVELAACMDYAGAHNLEADKGLLFSVVESCPIFAALVLVLLEVGGVGGT